MERYSVQCPDTSNEKVAGSDIAAHVTAGYACPLGLAAPGAPSFYAFA